MQWDPPSDTVSVACDGVTDEFFLYEMARMQGQAQALIIRVSEMERIFKKRSAEQDQYISYLRDRIHELERKLQSKEQTWTE